MLRAMFLIPRGFWNGAGTAVGSALLIALAMTAFVLEEKKSDARSPSREMPEPRAQTQFQIGAPAIDFEPKADWLNTEKPLSLADLKGRVVLLDFWTLC